MQYRVLGPVSVVRDGAEIPLGSRQQRTVLALLLASAGRSVGDDLLIDALWRDAPPPSAQNNLQALVSRLRRALGVDAIERRGESYVLELRGATLDAQLFETGADDGRRLLEAGKPAEAEAALREALALFRGDPYADFRYDGFAAAEIARLEQKRMVATEDRLDALLELGRHRDVVAEAEALAAINPYHEPFRRQLVIALYRSGRQADALASYRAARRALVDDLGVEPSQAFRELERRILQQDPALLVRPTRPRSRLSRRLVLAGAVCLAAAVVAGVVATRGEPTAPNVEPNSLVGLDTATGRMSSSFRLPFQPRAVAASGRDIWVGALRTNTLVRIDASSGSVVQSVGLPGGAPLGLTADDGGAWVASATSRTAFALERFVPGRDEAARTIVWDSRAFFSVGERTAALTEGGGSLWAANGEAAVDAFDPRTGDRVAHVVPDDGCGRIAWGGGAIWCVFTLSDTLTRVDEQHAAWTIPLAQSGQPLTKVGTARRGDVDPSAVAYGFGSVWVAAYGVDSVIRVDPVQHTVLATIPVGDGPTAVTTAGEAVWVANRLGRSVTRIDPKLNRVTGTTMLGYAAESLAVTRGRVWVVVQSR